MNAVKNFIRFHLICIALVSTALAGVQNFPVTPVTLAGWQITGANTDSLAKEPALSLPPGSELTRTFANGPTMVYAVSRPVFSTEVNDWPVLQVGPAALTFLRNKSQGILVLLVGETITTLPMEVAIDANGRSSRNLEIALGYNPSTGAGVVACGDQVLSFTGSKNSDATLVSIAAGAVNPWPQDTLEVLVITPVADESASQTASDLAGAKPQAASLKALLEKLREAESIAKDHPAGTTASTSSVEPRAASQTVGLEVFTPPSVRRSAAAVRIAVEQTTKR
jgi:hypothetical protein